MTSGRPTEDKYFAQESAEDQPISFKPIESNKAGLFKAFRTIQDSWKSPICLFSYLSRQRMQGPEFLCCTDHFAFMSWKCLYLRLLPCHQECS